MFSAFTPHPHPSPSPLAPRPSPSPLTPRPRPSPLAPHPSPLTPHKESLTSPPVQYMEVAYSHEQTRDHKGEGVGVSGRAAT